MLFHSIIQNIFTWHARQLTSKSKKNNNQFKIAWIKHYKNQEEAVILAHLKQQDKVMQNTIQHIECLARTQKKTFST